MISTITRITKSGLLFRNDPSIGMLTYSPYTGLVHAIHEDAAKAVVEWLDTSMSVPPSDVYSDYLWGGWGVPPDEIKHIMPHLLPDAEHWTTLPVSREVIVVNWLLTGLCPLKCIYCYAEDLMRRENLEPSVEDILPISQAILALNPLVVVLTGGDPLVSTHLKLAIEQLAGRVGIIVDTSGCFLQDEHIELFKHYNVAVRISLDSERPQINNGQRPFASSKYVDESSSGSAGAALSALCRCLDASLSVTVQTVATKKTTNDLPALGDKLYRLGIRSWRILKVAPSKSKIDIYPRLVGTKTDDGRRLTGKQARGGYDFMFNKIRIAAKTVWSGKMAVQVANNDAPNAVVLVGPDGTFYTESTVRPEKIILDEVNPRNPDPIAILPRLNMSAHTERYLNLSMKNID
ncbi:MAG: radical SAM protein [Armatimonadetes bacterium]|nr:radical SAM protein [Armatimonadota bacterium]